MTRLVHQCHFEFGSRGNLKVLPAVLGWSTKFSVGEAYVTVAFPTQEQRLQPPWGGGPDLGVKVVLRLGDEPRVFAIEYFTVTVEFNVDVSEAALAGDSKAEDARKLHDHIDAADALAVEAAARTRRWLFVQQPDLGPSEELPPRMWSERIKRSDTGQEIRSAPTITLYGGISEKTAVLPEYLQELAGHLAGLRDPPEPETLLAQARAALIHQTGRSVQPELAVLLAAVASEVKAKRTWETIVTDDARPVLDLMFANPRTFPQAAIDLFDKIALAIGGRSFRKDDSTNFKQLTALFELRNDVAHRAQRIDESAARKAVLSVPPAFMWLDQVRLR